MGMATRIFSLNGNRSRDAAQAPNLSFYSTTGLLTFSRRS